MFKQGRREPPAAANSLSDIVFMLLFFFMVTTQMRETEQKVIVRIPKASESVKLERKDLACYINIGRPTKQYQMLGDDFRIQLNDSFKTVEDIKNFIAAERDSKKEEEKGLMTTVIRADESAHMGLITEVKEALRRCSALHIMYSANKPAE